MRQPVVFCDFDGTITAVETFAGMLKEFAPQKTAEVFPQLYNHQISLRDGVRKVLESIPSEQYEAAIAYADDKPIRPGLRELLDFLDSKKIAFHVVSGGLRGMVERVLHREQLRHRVASVTAVEVETTAQHWRVPAQQYEGETELVAKAQVMAQYSGSSAIAIGDSLTDLNLARQADVVFARDRLATYLDQENRPYLPWTDFRDIQETLEKEINN